MRALRTNSVWGAHGMDCEKHARRKGCRLACHYPRNSVCTSRRRDSRGHPIADIRAEGGDLLARVDAEQATELMRRALIVPNGRRHYRATDPEGVKLWARTRAGGSKTTIGTEERSWHRALRGMVR